MVPEAFQALKQCAEMLGDRMQPPLVEQLLQQCAKHARHGSPWPVRKQAVDALGALAASLQACRWLKSPDIPSALKCPIHSTRLVIHHAAAGLLYMMMGERDGPSTKYACR